MRLFGITGGIGMGKTTAAQCLRQHGIPVVDTDDLARAVMEPGQPALAEVLKVFGTGFADAQGRLLRDELARLIFADAQARRSLEQITHPRIQQMWREQVGVWRAEGRPQGVVVIPLLFETGAEVELDATICVVCSTATQRRRLLDRGWSEDEIQKRNAAQWPAQSKVDKADYVVWSEGGLELFFAQLARIFHW